MRKRPWRGVAFGVVGAVLALSCAPAGTGSTNAPVSVTASTAPSASASAPAGELAKLRARGTLIATSALGPNAKVELRSVGGDRLLALDQGADIAMTVETPTSRDRALISAPYAASSVVLAAKGVARSVASRTWPARPWGSPRTSSARDIAQAFLRQHGIAATLDNYMGVNGALIALEADRAVAVIGDRIGVAVVATERGLTVVAEIAPRPYIIATRESAPDLATAVNDALRAALASGAIRDAATKASFPYQAP